MNLFDVVLQSDPNTSGGDQPLLPACLAFFRKSFEADWQFRFRSYQTATHGDDVISVYYFETPEQLESQAFKKHIESLPAIAGNRSLALLGFTMSGLCPSAAVWFKDVLFVEADAQANIQNLSAALKKIIQPSSHRVSKSVLSAFLNLSFVGQSKQYQNLVAEVNRLAQCHAPVLIEGETGTGKELLARALHYFSDDKPQGFVPINCAAIPDSLLESELFGHEKGAFTHAQQKNPGLIELAEGGTLFLDEVDSLSSKAQTALLRFLQTGEARAVGSSKIRRTNVRVLAATNTPLSQQVAQNNFREDLYFRLNVLNLRIPPLRERIADLEIIAQHLLKRFEKQYQRGKKLLHPDLLLWLKQQTWPGNVRELENYLLRRYLLSESTVLDIEDSSQNTPPITAHPELTELSFQDAKDRIVEDFTEGYISSMLSKTAGNVTRAAKLAGKERRAFGKLMKKYNIDARNFQLG